MPGKSSLRAVRPGETATSRPQRSKTVAQAAAGGSHRELLVAMRARIAKTVSAADCPPRDLASLTRRLQEIAKEIEAIDLQAGEDGDGESGGDVDDSFDAEAL